MVINKQKKENHNRAIVMVILAMFIAIFVSLNAGEFLISSALYIGILIVSIFLYFIWNKF